MMWHVVGKSVHPWMDLTPETVLFAYDGPKTFTCKDGADDLFLAHYCDEDENSVRFLVVAFSELLLERLMNGKINMRDALTRPRAWLFDVDHDAKPVRAWRIDVDELPAGILPEPGVMLWRHLPRVTERMLSRPASHSAVINIFSYPNWPHERLASVIPKAAVHA